MKKLQLASLTLVALLLAGCGASAASTAESTSEAVSTEETAPAATAAPAETQAPAAALPDGVYTAKFNTDSSMFHANEACDGKGTLTVENGQMTFHVSLASTHIVNLYLGKASDAADHEADWLQPTTDTVHLFRRHLGGGVRLLTFRSLLWMPTLIWPFWAPRASGTIMSSACVMPWKRLRKPRPRQTAPTPVR